MWSISQAWRNLSCSRQKMQKMWQDRTFPDCVSNKECERSKIHRIKALQTQLLYRICDQRAEGRTLVCYASDRNVERVVQGQFKRWCLNTRHRVIPADCKSAWFETDTRLLVWCWWREYAIDFYVINGSNLLGRTDAKATGFSQIGQRSESHRRTEDWPRFIWRYRIDENLTDEY